MVVYYMVRNCTIRWFIICGMHVLVFGWVGFGCWCSVDFNIVSGDCQVGWFVVCGM
jgi:hypothetical protein